MGKFTTEHSLTSVKVAKQGVVAVIMEDGEVTWVNVYDSEGNVIVKNKTSMGRNLQQRVLLRIRTSFPFDARMVPDLSRDVGNHSGCKFTAFFGNTLKNLDVPRK